ncbi:protein CD300H-like [Engraulis encrasicolus]|uniref:protein CD300H-like n=1 Tax=Engraulis encrasicolus TaxID=184585 RepID=UPI002FD32B29
MVMVRQILLCLLAVVVDSSPEIMVSGAEGQDVDIQCRYPDGHQETPKYLCRQRCWEKDVLIRAFQVTEGRYSLHDNPSALYFTVKIRNVTLKDAGIYFCGLSLRGIDTLNKKISLIIQKEPPTSHSTSHPHSSTSSSSSNTGWIQTPPSSTDALIDNTLSAGLVAMVAVCAVLVLCVTVGLVIILLRRRSQHGHTHTRSRAVEGAGSTYANVSRLQPVQPHREQEEEEEEDEASGVIYSVVKASTQAPSPASALHAPSQGPASATAGLIAPSSAPDPGVIYSLLTTPTQPQPQAHP